MATKITLKDLAKELQIQTSKMISKSSSRKNKFEDEFNDVLRDLFDKKNLVKKIMRMNGDKSDRFYYKNVMESFESEKLLGMLLNDYYRSVLRKCVLGKNSLDNDLSMTESEKEKLESVIKKSIKRLKKDFNLKNTRSDDDWDVDDYKDLKSFAKGKGKSRKRSLYDDDWDDDDDYDRWYDDDDDDDYDKCDIADAISSIYKKELGRGYKKNVSLKDALIDSKPRRRDLYDDDWDDDDDDYEEEERNSKEDLANIVKSAMSPITKSISDLNNRITKLEINPKKEVQSQSYPVPPKPAAKDKNSTEDIIGAINALGAIVAKNNRDTNERINEIVDYLNQMEEDDDDDIVDEEGVTMGNRVTADDVLNSWVSSPEDASDVTNTEDPQYQNPIRLKGQQ